MVSFETITDKVKNGVRLDSRDALFLYKTPDLASLAHLASSYNESKNGKTVFYNINRHINPTNICAMTCKFCAYSRKPGDEGGYEYSEEEIVEKARLAVDAGATEVHMVGGLHPRWKFGKYVGFLKALKSEFPDLHIKAFTAVEISWLARKARKTIPEVLEILKEAGLGSMPGGGAEIFHQDIRDEICAKLSAEEWLDVHRTAHNMGMYTNCTMLYGHVETIEHRIDHMDRLRTLQDETGGFNAFIPLSFQPDNNEMGIERYTSGLDDLRNIAVARLFLDNFSHIKAYWIMLGQDIAQLALDFGANDLDGTVTEEKISRMAGGRAGMELSRQDIEHLIRRSGKVPVERDTLYNALHVGDSPYQVDPVKTIDWSKPFTALSHEKALQLVEASSISDLMKLVDSHQLEKSLTYSNSSRIVASDLSPKHDRSLEPLVVQFRSKDSLPEFLASLSSIAQNNQMVEVAGMEALWAKSHLIDGGFSKLIETLKGFGVISIRGDRLEQVSYSFEEILEMYDLIHERGIRTVSQVGLRLDAEGHPMWDVYLLELRSLHDLCRNGEGVRMTEVIALDSGVTVKDYVKAVAMARLTMSYTSRVICPYQNVPTLGNHKSAIGGVSGLAQEKFAWLLPLFGAEGLGKLPRKVSVPNLGAELNSLGYRLEPAGI